jgi:tetratricopeptide (TPR) repeat protein
LAPDLPDIPYSIAVSYFIADDFEQAASYVSQAIRLDPKDDRALFLLGISLFSKNKMQEAEKYLDQAIRLKPQNPFCVLAARREG